jgi:hypothetical protein
MRQGVESVLDLYIWNVPQTTNDIQYNICVVDQIIKEHVHVLVFLYQLY